MTRAADATRTVLADLVLKAGEDAQPAPVFVPLTYAGSYSAMMRELTRNLAWALAFVQRYGEENMMPCEECENSLCGSEDGKTSGMLPFFGCRSLPGEFGHPRGNCVRLGCDAKTKNYRCSWTDDAVTPTTQSIVNTSSSFLNTLPPPGTGLRSHDSKTLRNAGICFTRSIHREAQVIDQKFDFSCIHNYMQRLFYTIVP